MAGGTFTISNGGVYGSMLSTPIINPPQSAILGMHAITQRATVVGKEILPRPIMNVALTYDHRLIDGREVHALLTMTAARHPANTATFACLCGKACPSWPFGLDQPDQDVSKSVFGF